MFEVTLASSDQLLTKSSNSGVPWSGASASPKMAARLALLGVLIDLRGFTLVGLGSHVHPSCSAVVLPSRIPGGTQLEGPGIGWTSGQSGGCEGAASVSSATVRTAPSSGESEMWSRSMLSSTSVSDPESGVG